MNVMIHGNCVNELSKLQSDSIDLTITSPPYKDKDGFSYVLMRDTFEKLYLLHKQNTLFFLNFGHLVEDKMRPFQVCQQAIDAGFKLNDTIIWIKNHYKPIQGERRLNNLTEFIFMLFKGKMPKLDRLAIGVPYADKSNAKRFSGGRDLKCGGNVWYIDYETINNSEEKLHHDRFPVELSDKCIKVSGLKSGTVLDPFAGSATVGISSKKLGLSFIGIEKNKSNYEVALERLNSYNI